jgi:hypothetical protein
MDVSPLRKLKNLTGLGIGSTEVKYNRLAEVEEP